jgi:lipopolysaccharide biosynthesis glycosyltransferase|tara:strand:+ start:21691 stop:22725 length:1035 start_codon:yes stop_codon:yes gene_type:complete
MHDKSLTFVTAADDGFQYGLEPLYKSFILANRAFAPLHCILMDCGLPEGYCRQLKEALVDFGLQRSIQLTFESIQSKLQRWRVFPPHWGSYATYAFLEAPPLAKSRYLVFADADMLHFTQLSDAIEELEASGHPLAAVQDGPATLASDHYVGLLNPKAAPHAPYLNGGYLIFDLERFNHADFILYTEQLDPSIAHQRYPGKKKFKHDQTLLNSYLAGQFHLLKPRYNFLAKHNRQLAELKEAANVHFISNPKPWEAATHQSLLRAVCFHSAIAAQEDSEEQNLSHIAEHWSEEMIRLKPSLFHHLEKALWSILGRQKKIKQFKDAKLEQKEILQLIQKVYQWSR